MYLRDEHGKILAECLRRQRLLPKSVRRGGYTGNHDERLRQARVTVGLEEQIEYGPG